MSAGGIVRGTVGVVGELAVTAGVVIVLFVVWQLGYDGVVQGRAQSGVVAGLEQRFGAATPAAPQAGATPAAPTAPPMATEAQPAPGIAFAILRVPRLGGPTWSKPVLQGTGLDVLAQGLGHYPSTALPGQVGNVAVAGHRAGHGNPLIDIDAIREGDVMVLETQVAYYVYRVTGHEIVPPTHVQVLEPVPDQPGVAATTAQLTLTSCDPRYGSTNRYIVFSRLERTLPRAQGLPAGLLDDPAGA
ncbi:MAG: class E sortase [Lapillicoccus sp.]